MKNDLFCHRWNVFCVVLTVYAVLSTGLFCYRVYYYPISADYWWMNWATIGIGSLIYDLVLKVMALFSANAHDALLNSYEYLLLLVFITPILLSGLVWFLGVSVIDRFVMRKR